MAWYEWPLLTYFMLHFFPPIPGPVGSVLLTLSIVGIVQEYRKGGFAPMATFNNRLVWAWLLFAGLLGLSLFQVPGELFPESSRRFTSDLLKGSLFGAVLLIYLNNADRARRLALSGALACFLMLMHFVGSTAHVVATTGKFPFQRDYLFWMVTFFPFALATYVLQNRWRWIALPAAGGAFALAIMTGFRGATLAMLLMLLIFIVLVRMWRLLAIGAALAVLGVGMLQVWFPEQAAYVLLKFQQTNASNRWDGHWLPTWDLSMQAPWLGHGYGHSVFRHFYGLEVASHPAWSAVWSKELGILPSAPHSILFETLFAAGWPGVMALLLLTVVVIRSLLPSIWQQRKELATDYWLLLGLAVLVSFVGNYVVFYQFETPAWRTLPILVAIAAACATALRGASARNPASNDPVTGK